MNGIFFHRYKKYIYIIIFKLNSNNFSSNITYMHFIFRLILSIEKMPFEKTSVHII